jgi:hypothetical protein
MNIKYKMPRGESGVYIALNHYRNDPNLLKGLCLFFNSKPELLTSIIKYNIYVYISLYLII